MISNLTNVLVLNLQMAWNITNVFFLNLVQHLLPRKLHYHNFRNDFGPITKEMI
jgi:hypothetical protein